MELTLARGAPPRRPAPPDVACAAVPRRVAVYFVASPLQLLAARQIARSHERGADRQVLVWYQSGVGPVVEPADWDAAAYMPWPRHRPLPGPFGHHRRLLQNLRDVAALVGPCESLVMHSAVFDTEAINYFLHALPRATGAARWQARILPDGLISVRRYPLTAAKRVLQRLRGLRALAAPGLLRYTCFGGDRIGSDAPFCDRIYVLPDWPHEYPPSKVTVLAPLVPRAADGHAGDAAHEPTALVIGQPLVGAGLLDAAALAPLTREIHDWLRSRGIRRVLYKAHPKDSHDELRADGDAPLALQEPLELWLTRQRLDAVVGVRSTALLFARQAFGPATEVVAFGWDRVRFKSDAERAQMEHTFRRCGVVMR